MLVRSFGLRRSEIDGDFEQLFNKDPSVDRGPVFLRRLPLRFRGTSGGFAEVDAAVCVPFVLSRFVFL